VRDEALKTDIGRILLKLEAQQEERMQPATKTEPQVPEPQPTCLGSLSLSGKRACNTNRPSTCPPTQGMP